MKIGQSRKTRRQSACLQLELRSLPSDVARSPSAAGFEADIFVHEVDFFYWMIGSAISSDTIKGSCLQNPVTDGSAQQFRRISSRSEECRRNHQGVSTYSWELVTVFRAYSWLISHRDREARHFANHQIRSTEAGDRLAPD